MEEAAETETAEVVETETTAETAATETAEVEAETETAEPASEETVVAEEVEVTEQPAVAMTADAQTQAHNEQIRQMQEDHRKAMMEQRQMMMNYFSEMMLKQNSAEPKLDANGKPMKVQRVIIVPVPAYSYGLNAGSHMTSEAYKAMHKKHHGESKSSDAEGNVVEPVK